MPHAEPLTAPEEEVTRITAEVLAGRTSVTINPKKRPRRARRPLTSEEICQLLTYLQKVEHDFDPRWVLLILVMLQTGLRITDALCLTYGLFFRGGKFQGKVIVPGSLNKGSPVHDYEREIHPRAVQVLERCYSQAVAAGDYHPNRPIFSGRDPDKPACYATARRNILHIFETIFGDIERLGAHSLRKSGARLVQKARGILAANSFLNHRSLDSTRIYLALEDDEVNAGCMAEFDELYGVADGREPVISPNAGPTQLKLAGTEEPAAERAPKMSWEEKPMSVDGDAAYFASVKMREARRRQGMAKRARASSADGAPPR